MPTKPEKEGELIMVSRVNNVSGNRKKKEENWVLKLYVAGKTSKSILAFENLKLICEEELKGQYRIEVIDLVKNPRLGREDQILALPTLVRKLPTPVRIIIGDLSNKEKVLIGLDIKPLIIKK